jgi:hypothetical protein
MTLATWDPAETDGLSEDWLERLFDAAGSASAVRCCSGRGA